MRKVATLLTYLNKFNHMYEFNLMLKFANDEDAESFLKNEYPSIFDIYEKDEKMKPQAYISIANKLKERSVLDLVRPEMTFQDLILLSKTEKIKERSSDVDKKFEDVKKELSEEYKDSLEDDIMLMIEKDLDVNEIVFLIKDKSPHSMSEKIEMFISGKEALGGSINLNNYIDVDDITDEYLSKMGNQGLERFYDSIQEEAIQNSQVLYNSSKYIVVHSRSKEASKYWERSAVSVSESGSVSVGLCTSLPDNSDYFSRYSNLGEVIQIITKSFKTMRESPLTKFNSENGLYNLMSIVVSPRGKIVGIDRDGHSGVSVNRSNKDITALDLYIALGEERKDIEESIRKIVPNFSIEISNDTLTDFGLPGVFDERFKNNAPIIFDDKASKIITEGMKRSLSEKFNYIFENIVTEGNWQYSSLANHISSSVENAVVDFFSGCKFLLYVDYETENNDLNRFLENSKYILDVITHPNFKMLNVDYVTTLIIYHSYDMISKVNTVKSRTLSGEKGEVAEKILNFCKTVLEVCLKSLDPSKYAELRPESAALRMVNSLVRVYDKGEDLLNFLSKNKSFLSIVESFKILIKEGVALGSIGSEDSFKIIKILRTVGAESDLIRAFVRDLLKQRNMEYYSVTDIKDSILKRFKKDSDGNIEDREIEIIFAQELLSAGYNVGYVDYEFPRYMKSLSREDKAEVIPSKNFFSERLWADFVEFKKTNFEISEINNLQIIIEKIKGLDRDSSVNLSSFYIIAEDERYSDLGVALFEFYTAQMDAMQNSTSWLIQRPEIYKRSWMRPATLRYVYIYTAHRGSLKFFRKFMSNVYKKKFITVEDCAYLAHALKNYKEEYYNGDFQEDISGFSKFKKGMSLLESGSFDFDKYEDELENKLRSYLNRK